MVNWYEPRMLLSIALKAVISGTFGNYADRREMEAAVARNSETEDELLRLQSEYCKDPEIWIDVVSDTGDGFNSTFSIAKTVAQKTLTFKYTDKAGTEQTVTTPRAKILIFGGDLVYPFPTVEEYTNRFKIPLASAGDDVAELTKEDDRPHLYAIPGNHDWYDGLGNFIKLFCQQRWIGIWSTKQHRSYFALPLPCNYWIWATDIQLNSDIDLPQLNYFKAITQKMQENDKVILITAEPAWVYNEIHKNDRSYEKLKFFIDNYIHNKNNCTGKSFKLAATLTGDLHHYARYCDEQDLEGHQYFTAGGGGAFLHLTHNLPASLSSVHEGSRSDSDIHLQKIFPSADDSRKLLLGNILFQFKNITLTLLLSCIYLLSFWITHDMYPGALMNAEAQQYRFFNFVPGIISHPLLCILTFALGAGFFVFSDRNVRAKAASFVGGAHAVVQILLLFLSLYVDSLLWSALVAAGYGLLIKVAVILVASLMEGILAASVMGVYLYLGNRFFDMHINEASSSLASPDYKNFLRLHIHRTGVTVYAVGIKKVPRKWKQEQFSYQEKGEENEAYRFIGAAIRYSLIEEPIQILNDRLK